MKVILLKNVPKIGKQNEIKDVSDGYARNFLFPHKLAVVADKQNIERIEKEQANKKADQEKKKAEVLRIINSGDSHIVIKAKANEKGHLFASIDEKQVLAAIPGAKGFIDEKMIEMEGHIKEVGEHEVKVDLFGDVKKVKVVVEAL